MPDSIYGTDLPPHIFPIDTPPSSAGQKTFASALFSKKTQLSEIASWSAKRKEQTEKTEQKQSSAPLNSFSTALSYLFFRTQKLSRSRKTDAQLKKKLANAKIIVGHEEAEIEGGAIKLTEEEFKALRQLYKNLNDLVAYQDCKATLPTIRKNWHTVNPDTIVKLDDKTSLNASRITEINFPTGEKISLIASMRMDRRKRREAEAFAEFMLKEGRQLLVVNLTEKKANLAYMPFDNEFVKFGASKKSYLSCFGQTQSNSQKPHFFMRMQRNSGAGDDISVKVDVESGSKFCEIKIGDKQRTALSNKHIYFLSSPAKDHDPIGYQRLRKLVEKIEELITKDKSQTEKTVVIQCDGGMGRTSQPSIALMMEPELEQDETPEELLVRKVIEYCRARRYFAVNELGFIALYCYARQRKLEKGMTINSETLDLKEIIRELEKCEKAMILTEEEKKSLRESAILFNSSDYDLTAPTLEGRDLELAEKLSQTSTEDSDLELEEAEKFLKEYRNLKQQSPAKRKLTRLLRRSEQSNELPNNAQQSSASELPKARARQTINQILEETSPEINQFILPGISLAFAEGDSGWATDAINSLHSSTTLKEVSPDSSS